MAAFLRFYVKGGGAMEGQEVEGEEKEQGSPIECVRASLEELSDAAAQLEPLLAVGGANVLRRARQLRQEANELESLVEEMRDNTKSIMKELRAAEQYNQGLQARLTLARAEQDKAHRGLQVKDVCQYLSENVHQACTIVKVHYDDAEPYYTVMMMKGQRERQTTADRLMRQEIYDLSRFKQSFSIKAGSADSTEAREINGGDSHEGAKFKGCSKAAAAEEEEKLLLQKLEDMRDDLADDVDIMIAVTTGDLSESMAHIQQLRDAATAAKKELKREEGVLRFIEAELSVMQGRGEELKRQIGTVLNNVHGPHGLAGGNGNEGEGVSRCAAVTKISRPGLSGPLKSHVPILTPCHRLEGEEQKQELETQLLGGLKGRISGVRLEKWNRTPILMV
ncbi:unnamed protein product [Chrysoparadoxa australica]